MKEEHKEHAMRIGKNILNLLIMYEKEQKDLAEYLGVGEGTVSRWIHGERTPRMGTIDRISKFFNVPRSAVLTDPAYQYYDDETVQIVTDRLRRNPEYSVLFKAASNVKPEEIEYVTRFIEKFSD